MFKQKPRIITKRCMKHFNIQGFLFDLAQFDWEKITLIPDIESGIILGIIFMIILF